MGKRATHGQVPRAVKRRPAASVDKSDTAAVKPEHAVNSAVNEQPMLTKTPKAKAPAKSKATSNVNAKSSRSSDTQAADISSLQTATALANGGSSGSSSTSSASSSPSASSSTTTAACDGGNAASGHEEAQEPEPDNAQPIDRDVVDDVPPAGATDVTKPNKAGHAVLIDESEAMKSDLKFMQNIYPAGPKSMEKCYDWADYNTSNRFTKLEAVETFYQIASKGIDANSDYSGMCAAEMALSQQMISMCKRLGQRLIVPTTLTPCTTM
jgi:hypothetical protein